MERKFLTQAGRITEPPEDSNMSSSEDSDMSSGTTLYVNASAPELGGTCHTYLGTDAGVYGRRPAGANYQAAVVLRRSITFPLP